MKIESVIAVTVDPARIDRSGARSTATAQASHPKNKETPQPQRPLQEDSRSADEIKQDIAKINDQLKSMDRSIRFIVDGKSKDIVVKVVDKETGDVIMQIPPEEVVRLRERLSEMSGLLMAKQV